MSKAQAVTRFTSRAGLLIKKNAPLILTIGGVAGGVGAAVLGARAALKTQGVGVSLRKQLDQVNAQPEEFWTEPNEKVKQKAFIYTIHIRETCKQYAPAIGLGLISIGAVLWGHGILRARNAALTASFAALERSFDAYRKKIRESVKDGVLVDKLASSGIQEVTTEGDKVVDFTVDKDSQHPYVRCFGELNPEWSREDSYNQSLLKLKQNIWNDTLASRGHVFLNEVLADLGFEHTSEGAIVGWLWSGDGDGYIDFGLNNQVERAKAFREGFENAIWIEFNVDGVIYDRI